MGALYSMSYECSYNIGWRTRQVVVSSLWMLQALSKSGVRFNGHRHVELLPELELLQYDTDLDSDLPDENDGDPASKNLGKSIHKLRKRKRKRGSEDNTYYYDYDFATVRIDSVLSMDNRHHTFEHMSSQRTTVVRTDASDAAPALWVSYFGTLDAAGGLDLFCQVGTPNVNSM